MSHISLFLVAWASMCVGFMSGVGVCAMFDIRATAPGVIISVLLAACNTAFVLTLGGML